ncbi:MAG: DinB family protein [Vicinamibacterales bacterium]
MRIVDSILMELDREAQSTRRALERVPTDRLAWQPHPKSMTLGQLALHIAQLPGVIAGFVAAPSLELPSEFRQEAAMSTGEVLSTLDQSLEKANEVLRGLDDATIMSVWTLTAGDKTLMSMPRLAVIRSLMLNHWYHHRGQLSVYLRELDVPVPSIYGPSADENPFAG